ncbi:hypothetical protein [Geodermatophilus obscurus]|uniref:hypothetical protein n=1 Tax=Geodermatophilus obscurus TaxID=1861 RepID=UPI00093338EF|nr:hypothetical protein [Geodermatophilus obscurus]
MTSGAGPGVEADRGQLVTADADQRHRRRDVGRAQCPGLLEGDPRRQDVDPERVPHAGRQRVADVPGLGDLGQRGSPAVRRPWPAARGARRAARGARRAVIMTLLPLHVACPRVLPASIP